MPPFSKEAIERPYRTFQAAGVVREKAGAIEHVTAAAREDEIVVAVVQHDLSFGGVWTLAREDMVRQVLMLEDDGGWSLIFSPNTTIAQVEQRCNELARIALKRWEAMKRWVSRHPQDAGE